MGEKKEEKSDVMGRTVGSHWLMQMAVTQGSGEP